MIAPTRTAARLARTSLLPGAGSPPIEPGAFAVVVDSREARPWQLPAGVPYVVRKLHAGDYSVLGREREVAIERKSLGDLVTTLFGKGTAPRFEPQWHRFQRELGKLASYRHAAIVVECSVADLADHRYRLAPDDPIRRSSISWANRLDTLEPAEILRRLQLVERTWKIPTVWGISHAHAGPMAVDMLRGWSR
jgi:hypothetical protein